MTNTLETIIAESTPAPVTASGRLPTAQIIVLHARIGKQLQMVADAYQSIPDGTPESIRQSLSDVIKYANALILNAERLLEANR